MPDPFNLTPFELSLARDGALTRFWRRNLLDEAVDWLYVHDYTVIRMQRIPWNSIPEMYSGIAEGFALRHVPENLDALESLLYERFCAVEITEYRYVLVFEDFDECVNTHPRVANSILDIVERTSRYALLLGRVVLCLIHTEDPTISFDQIGIEVVKWNASERLARLRDSSIADPETRHLWTG